MGSISDIRDANIARYKEFVILDGSFNLNPNGVDYSIDDWVCTDLDYHGDKNKLVKGSISIIYSGDNNRTILIQIWKGMLIFIGDEIVNWIRVSKIEYLNEHKPIIVSMLQQLFSTREAYNDVVLKDYIGGSSECITVNTMPRVLVVSGIRTITDKEQGIMGVKSAVVLESFDVKEFLSF